MSINENLGIQWNGDQTAHRTIVPKKFATLWNGSGATIAAGQCVQLDLSVTTQGVGKAIKLSDNATPLQAIGGTVKAIPNLSWGEVQIEGDQESVNVLDAATAGTYLIPDGTTDGRLASVPAGMTTDDAVVVAFALTDGDGSNLGTVRWCNPQKL